MQRFERKSIDEEENFTHLERFSFFLFLPFFSISLFSNGMCKRVKVMTRMKKMSGNGERKVMREGRVITLPSIVYSIPFVAGFVKEMMERKKRVEIIKLKVRLAIHQIYIFYPSSSSSFFIHPPTDHLSI